MKAALPRDGEADVLAALRDLDVLDSAPDPEVDALAAIAAAVCGVPIALVSLVDDERQWFKANIGLPGTDQTPRELAFCAHAVRADEILEVQDARLDERFADNPLVVGDPSIRFYAGAPVTVGGRHRIGTVCVIDREPRRLSDLQRDVLHNLAIAVGKALEGRAASRKLAEQMARVAERERMLRLVLDSLPSIMAYWDTDLCCRFTNKAHETWHGEPPEKMIGRYLHDLLPPAVFASNAALFEKVLGGERVEVERVIQCVGGVERDGLLFYVPDIVDGRVVGFLTQITDVTPLKAGARALQDEKEALQRVIELQDQTALALNDAQRLGRIGSWQADLATGQSVWSDQMHRIIGRDPSLPPPRLDDRYSHFMPESAERLKAASARCETDGVPYVLELELRHREDGGSRWIETCGEATRDPEGRIAGLRGTIQDITDRKRLTREAAEQHDLARKALQQLRQVTNNLPALISYLDTDQRFRFANQLYQTWLGHDPLALTGVGLVELYGQPTYDSFRHHIERALGGERVGYARELPTLLGPRHVEVSIVPDPDEQGRVQGLFVMMIDVTARRDAELARQHSEHRLRMVADNIPALVTYLDHEERYRFVNDFHGNVFHLDPALMLNRTMREIAGHRLYGEIAPHVASALGGTQVTFDGTILIKGYRYHYQSTYIPDVDETGTVRGFYAMTFDISALKETQRRLDALARVDSLTGLPNRRQFDERLPEAMARSRRNTMPMSLMFLDVDRFKTINDTLGHATGDAVLKEFALRLKRQVRITDMVARLAGDEFVVLLEGVHNAAEVAMLARKVVEAIRPPIPLADGSFVEVTTSAGIAIYDGDDLPAGALLAAADRALYRAKHDGRDGFAISTEGPTTLEAALAESAELPTVRPDALAGPVSAG